MHLVPLSGAVSTTRFVKDRVDQVKLVLDVAAAQVVFATRQRLGENVIAHAHAIKTHALARLGELLAAMGKADGGDAQRTRYRKGTESPPKSRLVAPHATTRR